MSKLNETQTWLSIGASQGAKLGFYLAVAYVVALALGTFGSLIQMLPTLIGDWIVNSSDPLMTPNQYLDFIKQGLLAVPMFIIFGITLSTIPAIGIGILSGLVLSSFLARPAIAPSPKARLMVGALFGIVVALIVNVIAYPISMDESGSYFYRTFIGIPSIVYIGACLWLSVRIALLAERAHAKESPVEMSTLPT